MSNRFETSKFLHLGEMLPDVKSIINLDPNDVNEEHLGFLDGHLEGLQTKFPDISAEIEKTRKKIRIAMGLNVNVSKEVMQAANNPDYRRQYRSVA